MNMDLSRRAFLRGAGAGVAGTALGAFGFEGRRGRLRRSRQAVPPDQDRRGPQHLPLLRGELRHDGLRRRERRPSRARWRSSTSRATATTRSTAARSARRARRRSTTSARRSRVKQPMYRKPGANGFEEVTWDFAMERIARLMKEDRDANFVETNDDGVTVNRWPTMGFLSGSSCTNETGWVTWKVDARPRDAADREPSEDLTRTDGVQFGPNIRSRCNDQQLDGHRQRRSRLDDGRERGGGASLRLQVGDGGQGQPRRQADGGRPALHPHGGGRGPLRADPAGHRHRLPVGRDQLPARRTTQIHHDYVRNYTNAAYIVKDGYGFEEGLFTGYDEEKRTYDRTSWEYEIGPDGFAVRDMTPAGSALRVPADEGALRALHARGGGADHRHAAGQVPDGLPSGSASTGQRRAHHDDHVRARLDAAFERLAEHPLGGDDPAAAAATSACPAAASTRCAATRTCRASPTSAR